MHGLTLFCNKQKKKFCCKVLIERAPSVAEVHDLYQMRSAAQTFRTIIS